MNFTGDTTSGEEGKELFYQLRKLDPHLPVILITAWTDLEQAIELVKAGAVDYIAKPWDDQKLLNTITNLVALGKANQASAKLERQQAAAANTKSAAKNVGLVYASSAMQRVVDMAVQVAKSDISVLITGANGSGKEKIAEVVQANSQLADVPFIKVNCGALPADLIEAELFGHEKGAFTGATDARKGLVAAADGGTLFLDEVGELPLEAQARLLRVLQEKEVRPIGSVKSRKVDIRLVAATHRNLKKLCEKNLFREDLFYRINVVNLDLPPLRSRGNDILEIADVLLKKQYKKLNKRHLELAPDAIRAITTYDWPGNIRELENSLERAAILCDDNERITHDLLGIDLSLVDLDKKAKEGVNERAAASRSSNIRHINSDPPEGLSLEDYFTQFVLENQEAMSETELAQKLGISRKCLWERRQKLGIPRRKVH